MVAPTGCSRNSCLHLGSMCGCAIRLTDSLIRKLHHFREINGASLSPADAYSLLRGMKALGLRVERQNQSALTIARWLEQQPAIRDCELSGLETHLHHESQGDRCAALAAC